LDDIYAWTDGHDERCVYWLNGLAGTGKSTIARTVARRHYERRSLGASFFFNRGGGDVSHARKFVTSIATQLAYNVPVSRQHICNAFAERPDISDFTLRDQWQQLVLRPLSALNTLGNITSLVLVIDALDECDDDGDVREVIGLLAEAQALSGPKVRVFLTSRPEVAIRHGFYDVPDTSHQCFVLHHIEPSVVDADIELFLKHSLAIIGREQRMPAGWPDPQIIAKMVQRASGLFIWAATAHRFIQQGRHFARQRLDSIIKSDTNMRGEHERRLDDIYTTILQNSLHSEYTHEEEEEHCKKLRLVLGSLVVSKDPLTVKALEELLGVAEGDIESVVGDLHAILDIPADGSRPMRLHHPSLRDFLLNKSRCTDSRFWIDEARIHAVLASRCIAVMTSFFKHMRTIDDDTIRVVSDDWIPSLEEQWKEAAMALKDYTKLYKVIFARDESGYLIRRLNFPTLEERLKFASERYLRVARFVSKDLAISSGLGRVTSTISHDDEALYSGQLLYAVSNWTFHVKKSGTKPVDHGEAFTFFNEYAKDWAPLLVRWRDFFSWSASLARLIDCVFVSILSSICTQILIVLRKMMLLYFILRLRNSECHTKR
jgi:hypothetical protein